MISIDYDVEICPIESNRAKIGGTANDNWSRHETVKRTGVSRIVRYYTGAEGSPFINVGTVSDREDYWWIIRDKGLVFSVVIRSKTLSYQYLYLFWFTAKNRFKGKTRYRRKMSKTSNTGNWTNDYDWKSSVTVTIRGADKCETGCWKWPIFIHKRQ